MSIRTHIFYSRVSSHRAEWALLLPNVMMGRGWDFASEQFGLSLFLVK